MRYSTALACVARGTITCDGIPVTCADVDRFFRKIDIGPGSCWIWTASLKPAGYGQFSLGGRKGRPVYAHRFTYQVLIGPIPPNTELDHTCRHRYCVNPRHLEPVPHRVNVLRGQSPNALNARKTHCKRNHEFTPENTVLTKNSRACRICINNAKRSAYHQKRH